MLIDGLIQVEKRVTSNVGVTNQVSTPDRLHASEVRYMGERVVEAGEDMGLSLIHI